MARRSYIGALVLSPLLVAADVPPAPTAASAEPASLAERIDLTRITVLQADYSAAAREKDAARLERYEGEIVTMLREEVLPYAPGPAAAGEEKAAGGAAARGKAGGSAAAARNGEPSAAPAGTRNGAGAARAGPEDSDARVVALAQGFIALEGRGDEASVQEKVSIVGSLQNISEHAHTPTALDPEQARERRRRVDEELRSEPNGQKPLGQ